MQGTRRYRGLVHPDLASVAFLLGTWIGEGTGEYPTIEPFAYGEEVCFTEVGKPFLVYTQRTWSLDDGRPLHAECGYWRPQPGGRLEVVLAHPTGIVEIEEGAVTATRIELTSTAVHRTTTAKEVHALRRVFEVDGDTLSYRLAMAAVGVPMTHHLAATLVRR